MVLDLEVTQCERVLDGVGVLAPDVGPIVAGVGHGGMSLAGVRARYGPSGFGNPEGCAGLDTLDRVLGGRDALVEDGLGLADVEVLVVWVAVKADKVGSPEDGCVSVVDPEKC